MIDPVKARELYKRAEKVQADVGLKPSQLSSFMLAMMLQSGASDAGVVAALRASVISLKTATGILRADVADPVAAVYGMIMGVRKIVPQDFGKAPAADDVAEAALALMQEQLAPLVARIEALEAAQAGRKPKKAAEPTPGAADQG